MNRVDFDKLTEEQKKEIFQKAIEVCSWIDWIKEFRAKDAVCELKKSIEKATGMELLVYT